MAGLAASIALSTCCLVCCLVVALHERFRAVGPQDAAAPSKPIGDEFYGAWRGEHLNAAGRDIHPELIRISHGQQQAAAPPPDEIRSLAGIGRVVLATLGLRRATPTVTAVARPDPGDAGGRRGTVLPHTGRRGSLVDLPGQFVLKLKNFFETVDQANPPPGKPKSPPISERPSSSARLQTGTSVYATLAEPEPQCEGGGASVVEEASARLGAALLEATAVEAPAQTKPTTTQTRAVVLSDPGV